MVDLVERLLDTGGGALHETLREGVPARLRGEVQQQGPVHLDLFDRVGFDRHQL